MHLNMAFKRRRTLNYTFILLAVLLSILQATNSQQQRNITWYTSSLTVTRNLHSVDYFDFWTNKATNNCSLSILPNVCESYGGFEAVKYQCKERCCKRCICSGARSTFIVQKQQCVEDSNVTRLAGSNQFFLDSSKTGSSCTNGSLLPTLDLTKPGNRTFSICLNGVKIPRDEVTSCSLIPNKYSAVDFWEGLGDLPGEVKNIFQINNKMQLKWTGTSLAPLRGSIMSLAVKCVIQKYIGPRPDEFDSKSSLFFKIAGSYTIPGPQVFYQVSKITKPTISTVVMTTTSTTQYKSKLNVVHVPGKVDLLLVIVSAALGFILFLVIVAAVVVIVVFKRKQKLNISGKHTSNPTYERGPDQSFISNGLQTSSFKYPFYQPLVENTRVSSRKEPIYESLDDHLRESKMSLTENPTQQRCSLAYCDVTSDGYLVPTDGPIPASCPTNIRPSPNPDSTTRPRLSSSYDEPEVMLKDRKPKLRVDLPRDENDPSVYHELEDNGEAKQRPQDNEIVNDNCKSPTENTGFLQ